MSSCRVMAHDYREPCSIIIMAVYNNDKNKFPSSYSYNDSQWIWNIPLAPVGATIGTASSIVATSWLTTFLILL